MSLRNNRSAMPLWFLLLFLCLWLPSSAWPGSLLIDFYQDHISNTDGNRCPMTPSCSTYAKQAIEEHGMIVGWVMACDRLVRCGRDEMNMPLKKKIQGQIYAWDPLEINDFWWFDQKDKK